jgi:predicted RecB family nuclease
VVALISPSKISAWLACPHTLTVRHRVETEQIELTAGQFGEMATMLMAKGQSHEAEVLARYEADGKSVFRVPAQNPSESFEAWVERVGNPMVDGRDVIYQLPMIHDGVRGVADFIVRVEGHGGAPDHFEAVDAKLARQEAKPGHVLQLCFYADALEALTGQRGEHIHLELGSGATETIRLAEVESYWRRVRRQLMRALDSVASANTVAERCSHCEFCEFAAVCDNEWRTTDSLVFVAGIRSTERSTLVAANVTTMTELAAVDADRRSRSIDVADLDRLVQQADLQVRTAALGEGGRPLFEIVEQPAPGDLAQGAPIGFAGLPRPDPGDVFLDFEGHPFWRSDAGLFFLFGLVERSNESLAAGRDDAGSGGLAQDWTFVEFWAHDRAQEAAATDALIRHLAERRERFPDMHVYHYNHTERTALQRLTIDHGVGELKLEEMLADGLFVDLFPIVKGAVRIGAESYGLKDVERLTDYQRSHEIDRGAGAVVEYERWMSERDQRSLDRIARYNEDDVRATRAVRDWLVSHRPDDIDWRASVLDQAESDPELDARIEALHQHPVSSPEHLMGDLLGYWRRERRAAAADTYRLAVAERADQIDSPRVIAGLSFQLLEDQISPKGRPLKWPAAVFSYPPQPVDDEIGRGSTLIEALEETEWVFYKVAGIDRQARRIRLDWTDTHQSSGRQPTALVNHETFQEGAKLDALSVLADQLLDGDSTRVGHAMLRRQGPRFLGRDGPTDGVFTGDLDEICRWATRLDHSCVAIQGPPGTGKTYTGAHIIRALVNAGQRVGVTAMTHQANDNLMTAVVECFTEAGQVGDLRAVRKHNVANVHGVSYINDNTKCAEGDFNVISGTPWLHASQAMRNHPVDVLVIDEAGQIGLADAIAASISTTNVILLGDPQQLAQVSQASHPGGAAASAIEHLLDGVHTIRSDRGVFLNTTWRMHSDVNNFISDVMYDGRLGVHPSCDLQTTRAGTGLRWLRVVHDGCDTKSEVEAAKIADYLRTMLDTPWTDQHGETKLLRPADFIVVAPYNDQVRAIRQALSTNKRTAKVEVGTVDRFQGREAAVVLFSMATSSAEFMPRNTDFLFSQNRLNVAISRARCLAVLVCTDKLLATRAKTVDEMRMIGALCSFVERATPA